MLKQILVLITLCALSRSSSETTSAKEIKYKFLIFPEDCLPKLLSFDEECYKMIISKSLSIGILVGSMGLKVPQILKIIGNGSTKGISSLAYTFELAANSCSLIFYYSTGISFMNYGEVVFLFIQNYFGKQSFLLY